MEAFTIPGLIIKMVLSKHLNPMGTMKLNVTQTDEFVSVDSEQTFDLSGGYALEMKFKSQNSLRGHFAAGIGDGNSKERTNSGGYAPIVQNGFTLSCNSN